MKFIRTSFKRLFVIEPVVFKDERGSFFEFYREDIFKKNGIQEKFMQDNHSVSKKGVIRGLHYQSGPKAQAKLVRVIRGAAFDVVVDLRKNSKTFGRYFSCLLSAKNRKMIYIPKGFAHGFCALEDGTEFLYKTSCVYSPKHERGLLWNDPAIGIVWPKVKGGYRISNRDSKYPEFQRALRRKNR